MNIEKRMYIFCRDDYTCKRCGRTPGVDGLQIAHLIGNNKRAIRYVENYLWLNYQLSWTKKFIQDKVIDNELDVVTTCSLSCNSSYNLFFKTVERDKLLKKIIEEILKEVV